MRCDEESRVAGVHHAQQPSLHRRVLRAEGVIRGPVAVGAPSLAAGEIPAVHHAALGDAVKWATPVVQRLVTVSDALLTSAQRPIDPGPNVRTTQRSESAPGGTQAQKCTRHTNHDNATDLMRALESAFT